MKNAFKIRTCSKSPVVRTLFFVIQCVLYNTLYLLKSVIDINEYELKANITNDIIKILNYGYHVLFIKPLEIFIKDMINYNINEVNMLKSRLIHI